MRVALRPLTGNWDLGYALHKHIISSIHLGKDEHGHDRFDNTRSEPGEALFQLKYRNDWVQVQPLAEQLRISLLPLLPDVGLIVPMPASAARARQPVTEIARELGRLANIPMYETVVAKAAAPAGAPQLKNLTTKDEKAAALAGRFTVNDVIPAEGKWNVLLLDDLFNTGASMEAVCAALRTYPKIGKIYAGAITQGRNS
ncbi:ComF family protein [Rhodopseudomonas pseudopalustris]|uniref:Predicted amidophosphoribosyltransferases n=1 Tax=Rhodopseudomonas pseudopalustris TaxID=1513892 RepID=A0A1H8S3X9_9BRAD|nr:ComF family protein [Rhodopseudomonas pseudopalustris]SEO73302.1 Predicted amidophosphoribosyltransferases [Rhodopseudomonas pseudopalustris]